MNIKYPNNISKSRLYYLWKSMKQRCLNPRSSSYKNYGARGISVCEEWKNDYMSFYNWSINNGYSDELSIDRINNDGNYEPSNCRWATVATQANNKSTNIILKLDGVSHTMKEWSNIIGIREGTLWYRKEKGWSDKEILTTPIKIKCNTRFTKEEILSMKIEYEKGATFKELGEKYNVCSSTACQIVNGHRYKKYFKESKV